MYWTKGPEKAPWVAALIAALLFALSACGSVAQPPAEPAALQPTLPTGPLDGGEWPSSQSGYTTELEGWFIGTGDTAMGQQENYVYLTHDGGITWEETGNVNDVWPRVLTCGAFANEKIGFLCFRYDIEDFGRIYRTTDGGETWEQFDLGLVWYMPFNVEMAGEVRSISFAGDSGKGAMDFFTKLSGDDPENGSLLTLMTDDFGATWESVATRPAKALLPLSELPADYGADADDGISEGVYVSVFTREGTQVFNQELMDAFYAKAFIGLPAFVRTMSYTVEGDPIIIDYSYDGEVFTVTMDATRDKFGTREITSRAYKYLVLHERAQGTHKSIYYLSSDENIYVKTDDGGTALREDLGAIPSPSGNVKLP
ncbi:MAG TPA: DUF4362 domain-containing protein [Candidatus Acidoferrum sp.]|nr:DUF4362 domain-containing protein [Candidatus Acidoferrum sp.]